MIKYLFIDVDGTLTDGQVYIGNSGELCKGFYVRDGLGIQIAIKEGIEPIIFTSRKSDIVINRCRELGITEIYQGIKDKKEAILNYVSEKKIRFDQIAYIADDINDLESMMLIRENNGLVGCPKNAVQEIIDISDFVTRNNGGSGAVRDFINFLMNHNVKNDTEDRINKAIDYVSKLDILSEKVGTYIIDENTYYIVQEYETRPVDSCKLESHRKYIDIQWIVKGKERIDVSNLVGLEVEEEYNEEKDMILWKKPKRMQRILLNEGSYVVFYPENGHMPCIADTEPMKIKKVVIKIKLL